MLLLWVNMRCVFFESHLWSILFKNFTPMPVSRAFGYGLLSDGGMLHSEVSFFVEWVDWTSDPNSIRPANQSGFHSQYKSFFLLDHKTNNIAYILLYLHELISPG